jgi:hypothetical protein
MFKQRFITFSLLTVVFYYLIVGQFNQVFAQNIFAHQYNSLPGITTNIFYGVEQDTDGAMWFVTQVGVVRYDGVEWHQLPDSLGLPVQENTCLTSLLKEGVALAGLNTQGENVLAIWRKNSWKKISIPNTKSKVIKYLVWEYKGEIREAHATKDSIFYYSERDNTWVSKSLINRNYNISRVRNLRTNNGILYIISEGGFILRMN